MRSNIIYLLAAFLLMGASAAAARTRSGESARIPKVERGAGYVKYRLDGDVNVLRLNVIGDVVYRQSDKCEVKIYGGQAGFLGARLCEIVSNTLSVECNGGPLCADKVEIHAPNAGIFLLYGVGTLDLGNIVNKELILRVYGNVEIKGADVDVNHFSIQYLGAGNVSVGKVKASVTDLMLSGVSEMRLKGIDGSAVNVKIPGVGSIDLGTIAANVLKVSISGVGNVDVKGKVNVANMTVTGSGEVNTRGLKARKMVNYNSITQLHRSHSQSVQYYM